MAYSSDSQTVVVADVVTDVVADVVADVAADADVDTDSDTHHTDTDSHHTSVCTGLSSWRWVVGTAGGLVFGSGSCAVMAAGRAVVASRLRSSRFVDDSCRLARLLSRTDISETFNDMGRQEDYISC